MPRVRVNSISYLVEFVDRERGVDDGPVPHEPQRVVDDERGEQVLVDRHPGARQRPV